MIFPMNLKQVFGHVRNSKLTLLAGFLASSILYSLPSPQAAPSRRAEPRGSDGEGARPRLGDERRGRIGRRARRSRARDDDRHARGGCQMRACRQVPGSITNSLLALTI